MRINEATRLVRSHEYPTTTTDLITAYGEQTLQLANGDATLGDALRVAGEETYPTASDAEAALMCGARPRGDRAAILQRPGCVQRG